MRRTEKIVMAESVPLQIPDGIGHSGGLFFFLVFGNTLANISRSMRPRGKIVGVENVPREILYKVGYSRVT